MKKIVKLLFSNLIVLFLLFLLIGCGPRFSVITGTNIGLNANSGDGNSRPPQVSLAYKRSEIALIPTGSSTASNATDKKSDAFSSLAGFEFDTKWWGTTTVNQAIATGHAARILCGEKKDTD